MTNTKYVASFGIGFSEEKDLKQLRQYAAKGWNVKRYKGMGYELEKGQPEDVIFSIDIRKLEQDEEDEYFSLFELAGWEHVCSHIDTHLFKAPPGTKKIYTDSQSKTEKLVRLRSVVLPAVTISLFLLFACLLLQTISSGLMETIFTVLFVLSLMLAAPMVLMLIALTYRIYQSNKGGIREE